MLRFLETYPLTLTPLTPVHVGCGEDFEPTNYVIEDGVLYHFDPISVQFAPEDYRSLLEVSSRVGAEGLRGIQKFFFERREACIAASRHFVPVASGVAAQYEERVGRVAQYERTGQRVINALEIERTAHHPHSGHAYIPGSSLKGAVRTAWLNHLNHGREKMERQGAQDLESRLLGGSFNTDPMRFVRLSDATGERIVSKIVFSTNHKKRQAVGKSVAEVRARGLAARREVIAQGQYRVLRAEIRLDGLDGPAPDGKTPAENRRIKGFKILAQACNRFYQKRLEAELALLKSRRLAADRWIDGMQELLYGMSDALKEGQVMLLRVGRHSGAESVTIEGIREIRILRGARAEPAWRDEATTIWLASEHEEARSDMQPFGFVLAELAEGQPADALRTWCEQQTVPDMTRVSERVSRTRARVEAELARQRQRDDERRAQEEAQRRAEEERQARLATLSAQGRLVEALKERLDRHSGRKQPVSGLLYQEIQKLIKAAFAEGWSEVDKRALADVISGLGFEKIDFGGKEKEVKRNVKQLRGEL